MRHLLLSIAVLVLTLSFVWYLPESVSVAHPKLYSWMIYFFVFMGIIYMNIYVCTPRLLMKSKFGKYSIALLIFVLTFIFCIAFVQVVLLDIQHLTPFSIYSFMVNVLSACVILFFLFLGTTSMALVKRWIIADMEKNELESSVLESELKLLKNQVNPHFLFNMLNNANMLLKKDKSQASDVLFKLEDLLRYQINDITKEKVLLNSEIGFLNDYLKLEKIRRDKFEYSIQTQGDIEGIMLPPLLFIIFVENAIKHNHDYEHISYVNVDFQLKDNQLEFRCENSKPELLTLPENDQWGLGLKNIQRRLDLLFADKYDLHVVDEQSKYFVKLTLVL